MSEITWPSELDQPYSLDYTNPFVQSLLALGVQVYISDDSLSTVTCVNDGSAGTSADITNNEQGTDLGNYRVGFDTSGLTAQEQADLDANPYQLFQTQEDVLDEHYLNLNGVDQYCDLTSKIVLPAGFDCSVRLIFKLTSSATSRNVFGNVGNNNSIFRIHNSGLNKALIKPESGIAHYLDYTTPLVVDDWYDFTLTKIAGVWDIIDTATQASVLTAPSAVDDTDMRIEQLFRRQTKEYFEGGCLLIQATSDSGVNTLYSFSQTTGTTVTDLYGSGNDATIVGGATFERVIDKQVFTEGDYSTITAFKDAQKNFNGNAEYLISTNKAESVTFDGTGIISLVGNDLVDFKGQGQSITGTLTLSQEVYCNNLILDSIISTSGNVTINNCEVSNATD